MMVWVRAQGGWSAVRLGRGYQFYYQVCIFIIFLVNLIGTQNGMRECAVIGYFACTPQQIIQQNWEQIEMKQQASQKNVKLLKQNNKLEALDGPPIDFSFKSIRTLNQLSENMPHLKIVPSSFDQKDPNAATFTLTIQDSPPTATQTKGGSIKKLEGEAEKQSPELVEEKLQIVRTIQTSDNNYLENQQKKTISEKQKKQKKVKKTVTSITTSLLLRYNKLTEIQDFIKFISPIFPNSLDNLMWVDLSHNRLSALSSDLGELKNLRALYLHVNYISSFKELEKLKKPQFLRTLTIHANPLETYEQFRIVIHSILPTLKKIDSTLVTKRETERAEVLMKTMKKYPTIKNVQRQQQQSENEEDQDS